MPINTPAAPADLHAVFAYTKRGRGHRKVRVSRYMSWSEALSVYERLERFNSVNAPTHVDPKLGAGGGPILWLAVRSKDDPHWNGAPRCTAVVRKRKVNTKRALA